MNSIIVLIILFVSWCVCNYVVILFVNKYGEQNELTLSAWKYRKTMMFDILSLIFLFIFHVNFLIWIAIIYYILISIIEGILIIIGLTTGIEEDIKNKKLDEDLWSLMVTKILNEIASILMIITLFGILK